MEKLLFSVSAFVQQIKNVVDSQRHLQTVSIKGEISNYTNHKSGHWYFTLKDSSSKISCVMFASHASKCNIEISEGMQVVIEGSTSVYVASGNLQVYVTSIKKDGLGDLFIQYEALKRQLASEGLFAIEHKQKLPTYPASIGIISAKEGAAIHDVVTTLIKRWPLATCVLYPSLVQGNNAPQQLITALKIADGQNHDVVLLVRGGGSMEDLWCFNDETLARFIYQMHTPIISGVGHENDTTLVDYVSDYRAPTPTGAAQIITPQIEEVINLCNIYQTRIRQNIEHLIDLKHNQLKGFINFRYFKDPMYYVSQARLQLSLTQKRMESVEHLVEHKALNLNYLKEKIVNLTHAKIQNQINEQTHYRNNYIQLFNNYFDNKKHVLQNNMALLDAYSPLKILDRGYTIASNNDVVVKSIKDIENNDKLKLRVSDGFIETVVKNKEELK